jgi:predicted nucleic acid-binding protein
VARLRRELGGTLVLDADGLVKLSSGDPVARSKAEQAHHRGATVVIAASTLAEVFRGGPGDTRMHRALGRITVVPIDTDGGRAAGELLGRTGLSGHRCALDALVAVVALAQPRPVVLLTSDTRDMTRLTEEPGRHKSQRVQVVHV